MFAFYYKETSDAVLAVCEYSNIDNYLLIEI